MPALSILIKPASSLCNMKCDYCFYCDESNKREFTSYGMMELDTLKNVIRKTLLVATGSITYAFQGGEPTLRGLEFFEQVIRYQRQYNRNNIMIYNALQTNGYHVDEAWAKFLHKHKFLVGVSVDGTREIHDRYRKSKDGAGTYDRISETIELFEKHKVEYNILTVVHREVAENIRDIYREYKERGFGYQQYIPCLDPHGEVRGGLEHALTPDMYGQFLIDLFELWYKDLKKGKQPYIRMFENYVAIMHGYQAEACDQRGECSIQYVVEGDGSVFPCDFYALDEYKIGNLNNDRLIHIDQRREEIKFIERSKNLVEECTDCKYFGLCRGGCMRNREWIEEQGSYYNYYCEAYKKFFVACVGKLRNI